MCGSFPANRRKWADVLSSIRGCGAGAACRRAESRQPSASRSSARRRPYPWAFRVGVDADNAAIQENWWSEASREPMRRKSPADGIFDVEYRGRLPARRTGRDRRSESQPARSRSPRLRAHVGGVDNSGIAARDSRGYGRIQGLRPAMWFPRDRVWRQRCFRATKRRHPGRPSAAGLPRRRPWLHRSPCNPTSGSRRTTRPAQSDPG